MIKVIRSGDTTKFWIENWCGNGTLKNTFPDLYRLEKRRHSLIKDRIMIDGFNWEWKTNAIIVA